MLRLLMATTLTFTLAAGAFAQTDPALREAVLRYVNNPVQQQMLDDMLSPEAIVNQVRAMAPQLSEEDLELVGQIGGEEMATIRPDLEAAMVEAAEATFSLEEITALEAFYSTPEGASVMAKMQPFMNVAMASMAPALQAAQVRIGQRINQALANR